MSNNKILPQEFHLLSDNPFIRTNCPQELVTDKMILSQIHRGNLAAGDRVMVQCMNHDYSELLFEREYRVTARRENLETLEVDHSNTRQFLKTTFDVAPLGEWVHFKSDAEDRFVAGKAVWNLARRGYVIEVDGEEAGFEADKETAQKIAAGELPLPAPESEAA